jgi:hypothetical protein
LNWENLEIERARPTKLFEGVGEEEWRMLSAAEMFRVSEALADPIRQWVYQEVGKGPLRQAELARRASDFFKRKITNVLMRYHLQRLKEAGLLRFEFDPVNPKRLKLVYQASELRVQARSPNPLPAQDFRKDLEKLFKGRRA